MLIKSKTVELKREYIEDIKKTLIAFANTSGGKLYIGIEDDGRICGVDHPDDTLLRVTNTIRDSIRPDITMFTECSIEEIEGHFLVVVSVQRGTSRPYYIAGKGIRPEGVFVRQGASTVPATETAILDMIKETSGDCYEEARSLNQNLEFTFANQYFEKKQILFGDQQKKTLGLIDKDGMYTNLALLLSDQCLHTIKIAVFEGTQKAVFKDRREISGSLLKQIEDAYSFIDRHNRIRSEFKGIDRIDIRDYPEEALREALLNAVAHRDYAFSGSILVSIFDDRIEIVTIGGLVRGITYDDIMLGVSIPRNKQLADVFYRLKLIEAYGTGIAKILGSYQDTSSSPHIDITGNAFKITLPNIHASKSKLPVQPKTHEAETKEAKIMNAVRHRQFVTRKEIQEILGVSQATASLAIKRLVDQGLLHKIGTGKDVRYTAMQQSN